MDFEKHSPIEKLVALMTMLRDNEYGCPWDLEQSLESLVPYTLEEVYEVVDAIDRQNMIDLEDELGDLLFQIVFYSQIAHESNLFSFDDVANAITAKLIRRHPHVFPDGKVTKFGSKSELSPDQVVVNWEAIKQLEKEEKNAKSPTKPENDEVPSVLDDVPVAAPALDRARKIQKRVARAGFDWADIKPVLAKLKEEIDELEEAIALGENAQIEAELGDVLFATVNIARHTKTDPEIALRGANKRFENRFKWIERNLAQQGKSVSEVKLDELDQLWEQAKVKGL